MCTACPGSCPSVYDFNQNFHKVFGQTVTLWMLRSDLLVMKALFPGIFFHKFTAERSPIVAFYFFWYSVST